MPLKTIYLSQSVEDAVENDHKKKLKESRKNKRGRKLSLSALINAILAKHYKIKG